MSWDKDKNELVSKYLAKWNGEKDKGLNATLQTKKLGRCYDEYTYMFSNGNGFRFSVDSSD
jgi:hypothetical protein